jgi:hypothetical protein
MAYTASASFATTVGILVTAGAATDAANNALSSLAAAATTPIGTPVLLWGVLVKCTTGWGSTPGGTPPVFSYDASPA